MVVAVQKAKGGKKQRKHGRNATRHGGGQNAAYKREKRREKSHVRRIEHHLRRFPNDHYARQMLATYRVAAAGGSIMREAAE